MVVYGIAFQPQPQRMPVDGGHHLGGHQWIAGQDAGQPAAIQGVSLHDLGGIKLARAVAPDLHVHAQVLSFLSDHVDNESLSATAGVVSGVAAALTAWQEFSGSDRKINR